MAKIIDLQNNYISSKLEILEIQSVQEDLIRKKWENRARKRWDNYTYDFTKRWSYLCLILIIAYCFAIIQIPIISFVSLITSPFIPIALIRFVIFKSIFYKNTS